MSLRSDIEKHTAQDHCSIAFIWLVCIGHKTMFFCFDIWSWVKNVLDLETFVFD